MAKYCKIQTNVKCHPDEMYDLLWTLQDHEALLGCMLWPTFPSTQYASFICCQPKGTELLRGQYDFVSKFDELFQFYVKSLSRPSLAFREGTVVSVEGFRSLKATFLPRGIINGPGEVFTCEVVVRNCGTTPQYISRSFVSSAVPNTTMTRVTKKGKETKQIPPGGTMCFMVTVPCPDNYPRARFQTPVVEFGTTHNNNSYNIRFHMQIFDFTLIDNLPPVISHIEETADGSNVWDGLKRRIIPAEPVSEAGKNHLHTGLDTEFQNQLDLYPIPDEYKDQISAIDVKYCGPAWARTDNQTFKELQHNLLFLEEAHTLSKLARYNMGSVMLEYYHGEPDDPPRTAQLVRNGECLLHIEVAGLEENRPSVLTNDVIYIWESGTTNVEYEGRVAATKQKELIFLVSSSFKTKYPDLTKASFNLRLTEGRVKWRVLHRAVDTANMELLHCLEDPPVLPCTPLIGAVTHYTFQNSNLNVEQKECVKAIVNFQYKGTPFLILGPFGSGKTTTLCEAIVQVVRKIPKARILVCTLTNSAADTLSVKLAQHLSPEQLYRACSPYYKALPYSLDSYVSRSETKDIIDLLELKVLQQMKVIVSTCQFSGTLYGVGLSEFTHVILDEAGQLNVIDSLIPISMATEKTNIVLCGDFHQLGPNVLSKSAKHHQLDISPLEELYKKFRRYNDSKSTMTAKLVEQHRCPRQIATFPFKEFYKDFKATWRYAGAANRTVKMQPQFIKNLKLNTFFPVVFHHFRGYVSKNRHSSSFQNIPEATKLMEILNNFIFNSNGTILPGEIAVVCEQYQHRKLLIETFKKPEVRLNQIFVGSTFALQGKEYKYVFISTVVSRDPSLEGNSRDGIWKSEKKLTTAMTRASQMVYILGDAKTLTQNKIWKDLKQFCMDNGSYVETKDEDYSKEMEEARIGAVGTQIESIPNPMSNFTYSPPDEQESKEQASFIPVPKKRTKLIVSSEPSEQPPALSWNKPPASGLHTPPTSAWNKPPTSVSGKPPMQSASAWNKSTTNSRYPSVETSYFPSLTSKKTKKITISSDPSEQPASAWNKPLSSAWNKPPANVSSKPPMQSASAWNKPTTNSRYPNVETSHFPSLTSKKTKKITISNDPSEQPASVWNKQAATKPVETVMIQANSDTFLRPQIYLRNGQMNFICIVESGQGVVTLSFSGEFDTVNIKSIIPAAPHCNAHILSFTKNKKTYECYLCAEVLEEQSTEHLKITCANP